MKDERQRLTVARRLGTMITHETSSSTARAARIHGVRGDLCRHQALAAEPGCCGFDLDLDPTSTAKSTSTEGMVWIPGGEFTMGTDSELAWPDETPAHWVRVDGFWIDSNEVTNAQFARL